jgi:uncharacterized tellurite resistance protein B-like protein
MPWGLFTRKSAARDEERLERMLHMVETMASANASAAAENAKVLQQILDLFKVSADPGYNAGGDAHRDEEERMVRLMQEGYPIDAPEAVRMKWLADRQIEAV